MADSNESQSSDSLISSIFTEIVTSPLNLALVGIIAFLVYKIFKSRNHVPVAVPEEPKLPKLRKDFTVEELKKYDGKQPDGRILVAVNGKVFDVTKGRRFYGPGKLIIISSHKIRILNLFFSPHIQTTCFFVMMLLSKQGFWTLNL